MKVIHLVLGKANPNRMNGVNKLVFEMISTQTRMGMDVKLWGITKEPTHNYGDRIFQTELFQMLTNKLVLDPSIKKAIEKLPKEAVVHMHGSFIPEFYLISNLLQANKIPYVYTPHGALAPAAMNRRGLKKRIYFKLFEKQLIQNAACLIATGKSVFENIASLTSVKRKILIPNGQPLLNKRTTSKSDQLIFGFCGRIAMEHKGLDLLLQGFQLFKKQGGKAVLNMIGDGAEMETFKRLANDLQIIDDITLYGAKFGEEKFQLLSQFDVFVHTSRMEGFPAAVLEAAAIGLPLLISRHTNIWDFAGQYDCGLLIDPNTPERIAEQMHSFAELHRMKKLGLMGNNSRRMIEENFDWKIICQKLNTEYLLTIGDLATTQIKLN